MEDLDATERGAGGFGSTGVSATPALPLKEGKISEEEQGSPSPNKRQKLPED